MKLMKSIGYGMALAVLASAPVLAADIPLKAPKAGAAAVVSGWTGAYVGIELGGRLSDATWTTKSIQEIGATPPVAVDASSPTHFRTSDPRRIGGYAGYNWQSAAWVYGIEADGAYANGSATAIGIPGCVIECVQTAPGPGADSSMVRTNWDASLRARLGYLVTPDLLAYATAGGAWQSVQVTAACQHTTTDPICFGNVVPNLLLDRQVHNRILPGWTIGAGLEAKIYGNLLLRGEYRFAQYSANDSFLFTSTGGTTIVNTNLRIDTHLATVGLAYKFGGM